MPSVALRLLAAGTLATFVSACASSTLIKSSPAGAKVYLDGEMVGRTPYTMSDTKIVGSSTRVRLLLDGYEPYDANISRSEDFQVGACIGGVLVLVPFLWIMGYRAEHSYELSPANQAMPVTPGYPQPPPAGQPSHLPQAAPPAVAPGTTLSVPSAEPPASPGCSKDTDCKGTRICVSGTCTEPGK